MKKTSPRPYVKKRKKENAMKNCMSSAKRTSLPSVQLLPKTVCVIISAVTSINCLFTSIKALGSDRACHLSSMDKVHSTIAFVRAYKINTTGLVHIWGCNRPYIFIGMVMYMQETNLELVHCEGRACYFSMLLPLGPFRKQHPPTQQCQQTRVYFHFHVQSRFV